jgi:hypothetical protein
LYPYRQFSFYGVYIIQLFRFARICHSVSHFNNCNPAITEKHLHPGYHFHKLLKFINFYYRYKDLIYKYYSICRYQLIKKGISHACFMINKAKKFKSKCYNLTTIVHSLRQVCFAKNIHNLLIQLERWTYG